MAAFPNLKVRARGSALVQDYEALDHGIRRYVGRVYDASLATETNGPGFRPVEGDVEVPWRAEYVTALRDGELWAANEATARAVFGADWEKHYDPGFGEKPMRRREDREQGDGDKRDERKD